MENIDLTIEFNVLKYNLYEILNVLQSANINQIKTYACLNKRLRNHRIWLYKYLYHSGLLEKGLVSMNKFGEFSHYFEGKEMSKLENNIMYI